MSVARTVAVGSAIQGTLSCGDLDLADKVLRLFKAPGTLDSNWAKAELLADLALSGLRHKPPSGSIACRAG